MADSLDGSPLLELVGAVYLRRCTHRHAVIIQAVESPCRIAVDHLLRHRVPLFVYLLEIPALLIIERRIDIEILEQVERGLHRNLVVDAVSHRFEHLLRKQIFLFHVHGITQRTGILQRYFLIPTLLAHRILALERVDARDTQHDIRERELDSRVPRVLRMLKVGRQRDLRPIVRIGNTRVGLAAEVVVHILRTVLAVTAGGEIDAR